MSGEYGAFGQWESVGAVETCDLDQCAATPAAPVDLYCAEHNRFLPFVQAPAGFRWLAGVVFLGFIYSSVYLTAQLDSWVPIYVASAAVGLAALVFPLRHYHVTAWTTTLAWAAISALVPVFRSTAKETHATIGTVLVLTVIITATLYSVVSMFQGVHPNVSDNDVEAVALWQAAISAGALLLAGGCAALHFALSWGERRWPEARVDGIQPLVTATWVALSVSAFVMVAHSLFVGAAIASSKKIKLIPPLRLPRTLDWKVRFRPLQRPAARHVIDQAADVLARAVYFVAEAVVIAVVTAARFAANTVRFAGFFVAHSVVVLLNGLVVVGVFCARLLARVLVEAIRDLVFTVISTVGGLLIALRSLILPMGLLTGAAWLAASAAEHTRRYLIKGSSAALRNLGADLATAYVALDLAWILLASFALLRSLRSAVRSAGIAMAYAMVATAFGGWIFLLLHFASIGRIGAGRVTVGSTVLLAVAFLISSMGRRESRDITMVNGRAGFQPADASDTGETHETHSGLKGSAVVAFGFVTGVVVVALFLVLRQTETSVHPVSSPAAAPIRLSGPTVASTSVVSSVRIRVTTSQSKPPTHAPTPTFVMGLLILESSGQGR